MLACAVLTFVGVPIRNALIAAEAKRDELELEKKAREMFVSTLTHDLKNPLTVAKAGIELLLKRIRLEQVAEDLLKQVLESIRRVDAMISDLLDANRIHGGELPPVQLQSTSLTNILRSAANDYTLQYGDRFTLSFDEDVVGLVCPKAVRRIVGQSRNERS